MLNRRQFVCAAAAGAAAFARITDILAGTGEVRPDYQGRARDRWKQANRAPETLPERNCPRREARPIARMNCSHVLDAAGPRKE